MRKQQATDRGLRFVDTQGRVLSLQLRVEAPTSAHGSWSLCVYASYWMVNKTGLPLSYKQASRSLTAAGQPNDIVGLCSPAPLLFSCDDETLSSVNKCQVKIGNSLWSAPVVMDVVGMALAVQVDRADSAGGSEGRASAMAYDLGVDIKYAHGRFSRTKVITWVPRIVVVNATDNTVEISVRVPTTAASESGVVGGKPTSIAPRSTVPYYFHGASERNACLRLSQELFAWGWSAPFRMDEVGTFHAKIHDVESSMVKLVAVEVAVIGAAFQVGILAALALPFIH
jgi:hypothetical protein